MRSKALKLTTLALLPATLLTLTSCSSTSTPPPVGTSREFFTKGVLGEVILQTFITTATLTAIDHVQRNATLVQFNGKQFIVKVGPEVANFDQIQVGDQVNATLTEKIVERLDKDASGGATAVEAVGLVAENTQLTSKIIAIDSMKRTLTLRMEDGTTQTFPIREDVALSGIKLGDRIGFRVIEITAIKIEKL